MVIVGINEVSIESIEVTLAIIEEVNVIAVEIRIQDNQEMIEHSFYKVGIL